MRRRYRLSPKAALDLVRIWRYTLERGGLSVADRVESTLIEKIELLSERPHLGHSRHDLTAAAVKFFPVYFYLIVYRPETKPLQIVAIVHGNREVKRLLRNVT